MSAGRILAIGTSMGGFRALREVLSAFPETFPLPIAVVQHRRDDEHGRLVELMQPHTPLTVREPVDKDEMTPGRVYLAPTGYHLLVEPGWLSLSTEAPVCHARPSIDVLFESAAISYGPGVIAVVLTGASVDGAAGAARVAAGGGTVVVQDPADAERPEMPEAARSAVPGCQLRPLQALGPYLAGLASTEVVNT